MFHPLLFLVLLLGACSVVRPPENFKFQEIHTQDFTLASWQKITAPQAVYKIYIEGDGHAFNARGKPTKDPTPHNTLMRELAFGDPSPNVIYLARPCQYVKSPICHQRHWTAARFAPEVIISMSEAVEKIAPNREIILIGYSGGAQVAGLMATARPGIKVKKLITLAGNLDHLSWTNYHHLPPLNESMELSAYQKQLSLLPQKHYAGGADKVMPPELIIAFVKDKNSVSIVENATHGDGWESIYSEIWNEY